MGHRAHDPRDGARRGPHAGRAGASGLPVLHAVLPGRHDADSRGNFRCACRRSIYSAQVAGSVEVTAKRGWLSVEAKYQKSKKHKPTKFRFVNTHFEAFGDPSIREDQAKELVKGPLKSKGRVVLVGDLNSGLANPHKVFGDDRLAFQAIRKAGYKDLGTVQSCCYPSALDDPLFTFDHTVDHVMANKKAKAKKLKGFVTGNDASKMTPGGLWPSDHGGVVAKLKLRK